MHARGVPELKTQTLLVRELIIIDSSPQTEGASLERALAHPGEWRRCRILTL